VCLRLMTCRRCRNINLKLPMTNYTMTDFRLKISRREFKDTFAIVMSDGDSARISRWPIVYVLTAHYVTHRVTGRLVVI